MMEVYAMKPSEDIKPISYFKTHASEIIRDVTEHHKTMVITQNGEAKVIVQDVREYEKTQQTLALLKILAQSRKSLEEGKFRPAKRAFDDIRSRAEDTGDL